MRKSFIIHKDSLSVLDDLSDEQCGELFRAIKAYQSGEEIPLSPIAKIAFSPFKSQFDRDNEKYEKTCKARAEAGSKGGKQKAANASKSQQKVANVADSDSKSESKSESKSVSKKPIAQSLELATIAEPSVMEFPAVGGQPFPVTQAMIEKWAGLYPAVDILQSLRNMAGWLEGNPTKKKTTKGYPRFINNWLSREQNRGGSHAARQQAIARPSIDHNNTDW